MFQIKNRWTNEVQFECELSANVENMSFGIRLGFAIKKAYESGAVLSDADLSDAVLRGADLRGADLSSAVLRGADLSDAVLRGAVLSDADLRGADWIPRIQNIHQSVYNAASAPNALDMGSWHHSCGTTHCRAGWVITLAGKEGRVMEGCMGTPAAAALIYQASDPSLERIPNFYADNKTALEDMKRLAELEAQK